jgi:hypothetical protein
MDIDIHGNPVKDARQLIELLAQQDVAFCFHAFSS